MSEDKGRVGKEGGLPFRDRRVGSSPRTWNSVAGAAVAATATLLFCFLALFNPKLIGQYIN